MITMEHSFTTLDLIESHHNYPDCFVMDLEAVPLENSQETPSFALYLSLAFSEQWEALNGGRIKFGIKGGTLTLQLHNLQFTPVISPNLSIQFIPQDSRNYSWKIQSNIAVTHYKEVLNKIYLGTVTITSLPCQLSLTYSLDLADLSILEAQGLWRADITPNQHGVVERCVARFFLENRLTPLLSWVQLGTENSQPITYTKRDQSESYLQLQKLIDKVLNANTNQFLELAKIASFNPNTDFAGANLLGVQLNELNLSEINLERANLRGAILTDTDLSSAQLSLAIFRGADLSGAFLENSNLSYADLQKSSLALANLIGTNLTKANLRETNITQSNFTQAIVSNAQFFNNLGISKELYQELTERGAIFE